MRVAEAIGMPGLHFHDLRHTANQSPATAGRGCATSWRGMGHDSERAAMIYQHKARGADQAITSAIDEHVSRKRGARSDDDDDGAAGLPVPA